MSDDIQRRLEKALAPGQWRHLTSVLKDLEREARPVVARFLRISGNDLSERTSELISLLVFPTPEATKKKSASDASRSKLLLPPGDEAQNAPAYRKKVVHNFLLDEARKRRTRLDFEAGAAKGDAPGQVREARRRGREISPFTVVEPTGAATVEAASHATSEAANDGALRRIEVGRLLSSLTNVKYRVAVAVAYGIDPSAWAAELAKALNERTEDTLQRLERLHRDEHDAGIELLYPDREPSEVREAFRKLAERGLKALRAGVVADDSRHADVIPILSSRRDGDGE